jgi:hypothetical protein
MRLRRKRFRASLTVTDDCAYPIILGFGPAITFEASIDEARDFALKLVDAIEQARRGGSR